MELQEAEHCRTARLIEGYPLRSPSSNTLFYYMLACKHIVTKFIYYIEWKLNDEDT